MMNGWMSMLIGPYRFATCFRTWLYERGWLARRRLPCPVVSVGNLTVGGTGKTPITMWVAEKLLKQGKKPCILSRGYRRKSQRKFLLVSDGTSVLAGPLEAGDEPYLMATRCPGVVVAVGADRYELGRWVLSHIPIDCFVLDDGFQHLSLRRDVNLLLVDSSQPAGIKALLPVGKLREPLGEARRASDIVLTRVEDESMIADVLDPIQAALGSAIDPITTRFAPKTLMGASESIPLSDVRRKRALLFSGIGNPEQFRRMVTAFGAQVVDELVFRDHEAYGPSRVAEIYRHVERSRPDVVLTTEKDLIKVQSNWSVPIPLFAVCLELEFLDGESRLESALAAL
ncbi:MAG: tetraacyldisaccharide 4'-kinase [Nitrospira sp.]|nr:tetraacyldisaccharide 4'-kinase [Nitrospira sp.]